MTETVIVDGRDMQPPEPMERTLTALDELADGGSLRLLVYCHPAPLFKILRNHGYSWQEEILPDGTHDILIRRA